MTNSNSQFEPASSEGMSSRSSPFPGDAIDALIPSPRRRWLALAILLTGNFVTILDLFIVNVAIPSIQGNLAASFAEVQLVLVGYAAAYGVFLMNGARLGDLFGRRRVFLTGMGLFTAASGLCGIAWSPGWLIAARVLQGTGAAILMPQVLASIRVLFEGDQRRHAFGVMGAVQGVAATISQLAGGMLIEHGGGEGWRLIFLINLPIGLIAMAAGSVVLIETKAPVAARLDLRGALTGALGLLLVLVPVMEGREYGWPWWAFAIPLLSIPVFWNFVRYENGLWARGGVPIIEMSLFENPRFVAGVGAVFLFYSAISSFFLSLTVLLQFGLGLTPLVAGMIFTPSAVAFFVGSLAGPRLAARSGSGALLAGILIFACGPGLSALVAATAVDNLRLMILSLILNGLGQGIVIPLAFNTILSGIRDDQAGMGAGVLSTMQTIGTSVGVTIVGVLLFSLIEHATTASSLLTHQVYGHALAIATIYNVVAAILSFVLFTVAIYVRPNSRVV